MSAKQEATVAEEEEQQQNPVRVHQPGQDVFRAILSEDIDWKPFPAFPPSVRLAVVVGKPSRRAATLLTIRGPGTSRREADAAYLPS